MYSFFKNIYDLIKQFGLNAISKSEVLYSVYICLALYFLIYSPHPYALPVLYHFSFSIRQENAIHYKKLSSDGVFYSTKLESTLTILKQAVHSISHAARKALGEGKGSEGRQKKSEYSQQCLCQESDKRVPEGPSLFLLENRFLQITIIILQVSQTCAAQLWATCLGKVMGEGAGGTWECLEQEENSALGLIVVRPPPCDKGFAFPCIRQGVVKHHYFAPKSRSEPSQA